MVRARLLVRFRRGFYAFADEWAKADAVARHHVRSMAVLRSIGPSVALSHASGVVAHGIDAWHLDLTRVHVTRLDGGQGRVEGDVVHHEGRAVEDDIVETDDGRLLKPQRCVLEAASRHDNETSLCLLDSGLRSGLYDVPAMMACHAELIHWPFMRHLQIPVRMADGRSGSVGESRGRWLFRSLGFPAPELQWEVRNDEGELIGTTDWAWPEHGLLGEFDGMVKYGRLLRPGQKPGDAVVDEKRREDLLREITQFSMVRLVWRDYEHPLAVAERLSRWLPRYRDWSA